MKTRQITFMSVHILEFWLPSEMFVSLWLRRLQAGYEYVFRFLLILGSFSSLEYFLSVTLFSLISYKHGNVSVT